MASTFFGSAEMKRKITLSGIFGVAEFEFEVKFCKKQNGGPKMASTFFGSAEMRRKITLSGGFWGR